MGNFGMSRYTPESKAGETGTLTFREALKAKNFLVVDVRTTDEFNGGHYDGAVNIPSGEFQHRISELGADMKRPIAVYCRSGARSGGCVTTAQNSGYLNVFHFDNTSDLASLVAKV